MHDFSEEFGEGLFKIELRWLEIFLHLADTGNMTETAARVNVTQSAVSQTISALEKSLNVELFDRSVRPLRVTPVGRILSHHANLLINNMYSLKNVLRDPNNAPMPGLRLGCVDSFSSVLAPFVIEALGDVVSAWSIRSGRANTQEDALISRDIDMIVTEATISSSPGLEHYPILREPMILVVSEDHVEQANSLPDLAKVSPYLQFDYSTIMGRWIDAHVKRQHLNISPLSSFSMSESLLHTVERTKGWSIMTPLCFMQGIQYAKSLKLMPLPGPATSRELSLIVRSGEFMNIPERIVHTVRDALLNQIEPILVSYAPWLEGMFKVDS